MRDLTNDNHDEDKYEIIYEKQIDNSRWSILFELVFKFENKFYMAFFERGATEYQDTSPFEYDADSNDMVDIQEVYPKEVTITKYVKKEKL